MSDERQKTWGRLKAAWLRQLQKDYLNLLWRNGLAKLPTASLELMKDKSHWGRWDENGRRILINEDLILNHPWEAVQGILGHETAHQLVSDIGGFDDRREPPHGPAFLKMGRRLGLDAFYLKPSVELRGDCPRPWPDPDQSPLLDESRKILEKVRKILALSGSPVEAEAQAAMKAAARLMARHNLEAVDRPAGEDYEYRRIRLESGRIDTRLAIIARILNRHFFVEVIFVPDYDAPNDVELKTLEVMGRPENTRLAEHVFHFLMERSESLWREYHRSHRGGGHPARNSFIAGLLEGFENKLTLAAREEEGPGDRADGFSALVLSRDQGLHDFIHSRHPRLRTVSAGRNRRHCPESGQAGRRAGRGLNINSPLESPASGGRGTRLLLKGGAAGQGERPGQTPGGAKS